MNDDNVCITKCINNNKSNKITLFNPFIGLLHYTNSGNMSGLCVGKNYNEKANKMVCDDNTKIDIHIKYALKNPIQPHDYLEVYYELTTIQSIKDYLNQRVDINYYTKMRIFDYICYKYFTDNDDFKKNIRHFLDIVKYMLELEMDNTHDELIIDTLKQIKEKHFSSYQLKKNLLDIIKLKILNYK